MKNKFRVWDKKEKKWETDFFIYSNGLPFKAITKKIHFPKIRYELSQYSDYVVQQFTGLHDKNGNEIYEADILKCPWKLNGAKYHSIGEAVFWRGAYCLSKGEEKESPEYCPYDLWGFNDTPTRTCFWDDAEIIGNIFEK